MLRRHVFYGAEWGKIIENGLSLKMVTSSPLSTIIHDFPLIQMRIDFKELNYRLFTFKKKVFYTKHVFCFGDKKGFITQLT